MIAQFTVRFTQPGRFNSGASKMERPSRL